MFKHFDKNSVPGSDSVTASVHTAPAPGTSEYPLPDCTVCHEPVDIDQFNHNGGVCNFCYHELSNDSYLKSFDLERRLL